MTSSDYKRNIISSTRSSRRARRLSREFLLHYQPQYDVRLGQVVAAEGLLRWRRHGRMLPPSEFLPVLESSCEILCVGAWVIETACQDLQEWRQQGTDFTHVSVNVSVRQLEGDGLIDAVGRALSNTRLSPDSLELEITESSVMTDPDQAKRVLSKLKDWGVRIAMDDFGTGHSSLSYLYRLPIDTVKIDRSFVRDIWASEQCRAVTQAIIALAKKLELKVVAEGVETREQRDFLLDEGCDTLQGYLIGKPMPPSELVQGSVASGTRLRAVVAGNALETPRAAAGATGRARSGLPTNR